MCRRVGQARPRARRARTARTASAITKIDARKTRVGSSRSSTSTASSKVRSPNAITSRTAGTAASASGTLPQATIPSTAASTITLATVATGVLLPGGTWTRQTRWRRSRCSAGANSAACSASPESRLAWSSAFSTRRRTHPRVPSAIWSPVGSATKRRSRRPRVAPTSSPMSGRVCRQRRRTSSPVRVPVRPGAASLEVSQDRLVEKETFRSVGIPTAEFAAVGSRGARARDRRDRAARRAQDAPWGLRRERPERAPVRRRCRRRLVRAGRLTAHPRRVRPLRTRAVDHCRARSRR